MILARALAVVGLLSGLISAAPSVKGGSQYARPATDQLNGGTQSQFGELQSSFENKDNDYDQFDQTGLTGYDRSQNTAGRGDYGNEIDNKEGSTSYGSEIAPTHGGTNGKGNGYDDSDEDDSTWDDKWNALTSWGANAARNVAGGARELGSNIANTATGLWDKLDDAFDTVWDKLKNGLEDLGDSIKEGASYCAHVLQQSADKVRSSEILQKLEDKVETGNEQVIEFFQVLGDKITDWSEQHPDDSSQDDGLTDDSSSSQQGAAGSIEQYERVDFPDFFQDDQVQGELEKLVDNGIIQQEEADFFVQQKRQ